MHFEKLTTKKYCRSEIFVSFVFAAMTTAVTPIAYLGGFLIESRENVLPLFYSIPGLPVDRNFSFNLLFSFGFQVASQLIMFILFITMVPITAIVMNHLCWFCDLALESIEDLQNLLESGSFLVDKVDGKLFEEKLRKVVNVTCDIISWQKQAQTLLVFSFLVEFSLLSVVLCMSLTSIASTLSDLFTTAPVVLMCTLQLFVYCWLGSRVKTRYDSLTTTLFGMNWQRLQGHQRRDFRLILEMCQNLKGFHGIFKAVDLSTFQKV